MAACQPHRAHRATPQRAVLFDSLQGVERAARREPARRWQHGGEVAPVTPLVVSSFGPKDFYELIVKEPTSLIKLPSVCFAELRLDELAEDPRNGEAGDLPYKNIEHLRSCLTDLQTKTVMTKMVDRTPTSGIPFRTIKNGFFVGNQKKLLHYPLPSEKELVEKYYPWWRSATM